MNKIIRYENEICKLNSNILSTDQYTFYVLQLILKNPCSLVLTDHERLVICLSCEPYPVWVWLPDDATDEELDDAWKLIKQEFFSNKNILKRTRIIHRMSITLTSSIITQNTLLTGQNVKG